MISVGLSGFILPAVAMAQTGSNAGGSTNTLSDLAKLAVYYFNVAIGLIIGLAMVVFIFNIYRYFMTNKGEGNKERGTYLMWSIIGFFVIISFWGLVNLIGGTFKLNTAAPTNFMNLYNATGGSGGSNSNPLNPTNTVGAFQPSSINPSNTAGTVNSSSGSLNSPSNTTGASPDCDSEGNCGYNAYNPSANGSANNSSDSEWYSGAN